jgi:hypothetical protein
MKKVEKYETRKSEKSETFEKHGKPGNLTFFYTEWRFYYIK